MDGQPTECVICYDNPPDTVIMPCGHGGICYECSLNIWEADNGCYLCRKDIVEVLQLGNQKQQDWQYYDVVASTKLIRCDPEGNPIDEDGNLIKKETKDKPEIQETLQLGGGDEEQQLSSELDQHPQPSHDIEDQSDPFVIDSESMRTETGHVEVPNPLPWKYSNLEASDLLGLGE